MPGAIRGTVTELTPTWGTIRSQKLPKVSFKTSVIHNPHVFTRAAGVGLSVGDTVFFLPDTNAAVHKEKGATGANIVVSVFDMISGEATVTSVELSVVHAESKTHGKVILNACRVSDIIPRKNHKYVPLTNFFAVGDKFNFKGIKDHRHKPLKVLIYEGKATKKQTQQAAQKPSSKDATIKNGFSYAEAASIAAPNIVPSKTPAVIHTESVKKKKSKEFQGMTVDVLPRSRNRSGQSVATSIGGTSSGDSDANSFISGEGIVFRIEAAGKDDEILYMWSAVSGFICFVRKDFISENALCGTEVSLGEWLVFEGQKSVDPEAKHHWDAVTVRKLTSSTRDHRHITCESANVSKGNIKSTELAMSGYGIVTSVPAPSYGYLWSEALGRVSFTSDVSEGNIRKHFSPMTVVRFQATVEFGHQKIHILHNTPWVCQTVEVVGEDALPAFVSFPSLVRFPDIQMKSLESGLILATSPAVEGQIGFTIYNDCWIRISTPILESQIMNSKMNAYGYRVGSRCFNEGSKVDYQWRALSVFPELMRTGTENPPIGNLHSPHFAKMRKVLPLRSSPPSPFEPLYKDVVVRAQPISESNSTSIESRNVPTKGEEMVEEAEDGEWEDWEEELEQYLNGNWNLVQSRRKVSESKQTAGVMETPSAKTKKRVRHRGGIATRARRLAKAAHAERNLEPLIQIPGRISQSDGPQAICDPAIVSMGSAQPMDVDAMFETELQIFADKLRASSAVSQRLGEGNMGSEGEIPPFGGESVASLHSISPSSEPYFPTFQSRFPLLSSGCGGSENERNSAEASAQTDPSVAESVVDVVMKDMEIFTLFSVKYPSLLYQMIEVLKSKQEKNG